MSNLSTQAWTQAVKDMMAEATTCSLATIDAHGLPHAANLNHVPLDDMSLAFISNPNAAHVRHLAHQPRVAATLYPSFEHTHQIRGLQMHCHCNPADPECFDDLWQKLIERFPEAAEQASRAKSQRFYKLDPVWIRLIDNRLGFGWRQEKDFSPNDQP